MALTGGTSSLKRLKNRYRITVMNEDTFEEVEVFKLTRWSVYTALSIFFVILVGLTIALIAFTPLKLYIPGYGQSDNTLEMRILKTRADSIENTIKVQQEYINNIEKILKGNVVLPDTNALKINAINNSKSSKTTRSKKDNK